MCTNLQKLNNTLFKWNFVIKETQSAMQKVIEYIQLLFSWDQNGQIF